jgi:hypothetical protein
MEPRKQLSREEETERKLANRELWRATKAIRAFSSFYLANAILVAVLLLLSLGGPTIVVALYAGALALMIAGIYQVRRQPFVWAILIAGVWTALVAGHLIAGRSVQSLMFVLAVLWTIGCWTMVPATVRVKKLVAQYPDLALAKKLRGGRGATGGGVDARSRDRPAAARGARAARAARAAGAAGAARARVPAITLAYDKPLPVPCPAAATQAPVPTYDAIDLGTIESGIEAGAARVPRCGGVTRCW